MPCSAELAWQGSEQLLVCSALWSSLILHVQQQQHACCSTLELLHDIAYLVLASCTSIF